MLDLTEVFLFLVVLSRCFNSRVENLLRSSVQLRLNMCETQMVLDVHVSIVLYMSTRQTLLVCFLELKPTQDSDEISSVSLTKSTFSLQSSIALTLTH